jgi:tetratricopeptide (TPR) repeat protein
MMFSATRSWATLSAALLVLAGQGFFACAADGPDAAGSVLGKGWSALYRGELEAAVASVERLAASRPSPARLTAAHIRARSLWNAGDAASRQAARQLWVQIANEANGDKEARARIAIAKSLDLAARGHDREAEAALDAATKDAMFSSAAAELAIERAILQAKAGRRDTAEATLAAAAKDLEVAESYGIPAPVAAAFAAAIRATRAAIDSPAKVLLQRALGLQRDRKYQKAIVLFEDVSLKFPNTDEDHRSQFEIGSCFESLGQTREAVEHWRTFTASAPAAPWRGQAFVRLIDSALRERLDLDEAGRYAGQAKVALPAALADGATRGPWQEAAYPLSLRVGVVALVGRRGQEAIAAFEAARPHAKKPVMSERLDALVAAASNASGVIPEEFRGALSSGGVTRSPSDPEAATLALSLGMVFFVGGEPKLSLDFFDRVLGKPATRPASGKPGQPPVRGIAGATLAQRAFASFGKGAILETERNRKEAIKAFTAALEIHRDAPWHDETLYRLARATDAPEAAVPFWRMILEKFPESPRRELAAYQYGLALCDQAASMASKAGGRSISAADATKADLAWQAAATAISKFTEAYPAGPYSGEVFVKQIDVGLERTFDLEAADSACKSAIAWLDRSPPIRGSLPTLSSPLPVWAAPFPEPPPVAREALAFRIYSAAGLVALLQERTDEAVAMFGKASAFDTSRREELGAETSMKRMIAVAEGRGPDFSPHEMLKSLRNEKQRTGVLLGDLALLMFDPERAGSLYERVLAGEPPFGSPSAELEAYLILRTGQALEFQRKHDDAVAMLSRLYEPKYAKYRWASDGIFRLGTWNHNATQTTASSMSHWEHVFTKTPDHPEAERALFYYGINAKRDGDHTRAEKAFRMYLERYPASRWTARIRDRELPAVARLMEADGK